MPIVVRIDVELARRKMSVGEFADRVGLTPANVAVLKNGRAKAVRFSTLEAMCRVLGCQPGDLLEWVDDGNDRNDGNDSQNDDVDAGNEGTSAAAGGGSAAVYGEGGA
jgi:putative transcriptional regulator